MLKKITTISFKVLYLTVTLAIVALAVLFLGTKFDILGYEVKVVQSGSMEPAIMTGGIVVVAPSETNSYQVGEVITFNTKDTGSVPVTHRVVEASGAGRSAIYYTKGDANQNNDPTPVRGYDVIGKVVVTVPYLGQVIEFARTPLGFILLIGLPALLIILDELFKIWRELRKLFARDRAKAKPDSSSEVINSIHE